MSWTWRDELIKVFEELGGIADYNQIKNAVERRGMKKWVPHSVRQCIEDHSSDSSSFRTGNDLFYSVDGIGKGIWGLREYLIETPIAADTDLPERVEVNIYRILRDTKSTKVLKALYKNCCQVCGQAISLPKDILYSEVHHLRPLGGDHMGLDSQDNMIVLCPNHHVAFDYGAIAIVPDTLEIHTSICKTYNKKKLSIHQSHVLGKNNIQYHYENIYRA